MRGATMSDPYILFRDDTTGQVMLFAQPAEIIITKTRAEFFTGLIRMEEAKAEGKWLAGYMSYEAGYLFEEKLASFAAEGRETPLLCFGIFDAPQSNTHPLAQPERRLENEEFLTAPRPVGISLYIKSASTAFMSTCGSATPIRQISPCRSRHAGAATPAPPSGH